MSIVAAVRYLTIPADVDVSGVPDIISASGKPLAFSAFFTELVVARLPWGTPDQQDTIEALSRLKDAAAGDRFELREADHAALVQAMNAVRGVLPGHVFIAVSKFFAAVARAAVVELSEPSQ